MRNKYGMLRVVSWDTKGKRTEIQKRRHFHNCANKPFKFECMNLFIYIVDDVILM
jgi:hypothetical protein